MYKIITLIITVVLLMGCTGQQTNKTFLKPGFYEDLRQRQHNYLIKEINREMKER